ncbi:hypothetical protein [Photobacterium atrarenae]|uniref:Colanic acid biosynthesis acetyltransferase n=1 Tax=Photobacterium atrarenae TaxID=865757 RepID=A0ABY5GQ99_9GAMM|nr:hypothetical protein [Photobacterium atrarenae]UTV30463.1 hypothetical protein NNL38_17965 [Photobacterium atrarenae]
MIPKANLHAPVYGWQNKFARTCWSLVYYTLFRLSPTPLFGFRRQLLRFFGARIGNQANIYPSAQIWLPANLEMASGATLGPRVQVYNQGYIKIGKNAIVSQGAHLCASTHDYDDPLHPLVLAPVTIGANAWVCADAFIGPGVDVGEGAVIGARSVLMKTAAAWQVYAGNPARAIKQRAPFGGQQ